MTPVLKIEKLAVSFTQYDRGLRRRTLRPVTGMNLEAYAGEVVALVGASGSGKTLLGESVLGTLPPNGYAEGLIEYDGAPLDARRRKKLAGREITMLPQSITHLDPTSTVGSQARRAFELAGVARPARAAADSLAGRGLAVDVLKRYPHQLSGGMARRVLLSMALAGERKLVFADEPTPGLDAASAARTMSELRGVADRGCAVVLVSHDLVGALRIADRVVVCHRGRTIENAFPDQFTGTGEELVHPYSRALWQALPVNGFHQPDPELWRDLERDRVRPLEMASR